MVATLALGRLGYISMSNVGGRPSILQSMPVSVDGQRLIDILADMIRSALAYEEEHGLALRATQIGRRSGLTGRPRCIHCPPRGKDAPQAYPSGIDMVAVNGQIVFEGGNHTMRVPGQLVRI